MTVRTIAREMYIKDVGPNSADPFIVEPEPSKSLHPNVGDEHVCLCQQLPHAPRQYLWHRFEVVV